MVNVLVKLGAGVVGGVIAFAIIVGVIAGIDQTNLSALEVTLLGLVGAVFLAVLVLKLLDAI